MEKLLKDLTSLTGPSGFEMDPVRYILEKIKDKVDEYFVDGLGNLIVSKKGKLEGPSLVVSAHMDEVGFIVKKIEKNGLIRFEKLGGHDDRILLAQQVKIRTNDGVIKGIIGTISAHMVKFDDPQRVRKHGELYIDIGAANSEEVEALGVQIGDPIAWATEFELIGKHRAVGKGFDDRAGCAVLIKAFEEIDFSRVYGKVYGVFSVQEEVGLRGAKTAAQNIQADLALAIDTTAVSDTFESMMDQTLALGKGPAVKILDASLISSPAVRRKLVEVAKNNNIPYQLEIFPGIGTDAGELHLSNKGIPSGVISIPSRYAHSPVEVIDMIDLEYTKELLKQFILAMRDKKEFSFI